MTVFNDLKMYFDDLHVDVEAVRQGLPRESKVVENKIRALGSFIANNSDSFASDLSDRSRVYQSIIQDLAVFDSPLAVRLIRDVEKIQYKSAILKVASQPKLLAQWLNECPNAVGVKESDFQSNPEKVLRAFDVLQKSVKLPQHCLEVFDAEVSKIVVSSLGLSNATVLGLRSCSIEPGLKAMALGHFINVKKIPLDECGFSVKELKQIAPYLMHVDCRNVIFKDDTEAQEFVQCCSNAYYLQIRNDKITELKPTSTKLRALICTGCTALKKLSLSNLLSLQHLNCIRCSGLNEVTLFNLPSLEKVYFTNCTSLEKLVLSHLLALQEVHCDLCEALKDLSCVNLPKLESVDFDWCIALRECSLSNLPSLQKFNCHRCTALTNLVLLNLPSLQEFCCSSCSNLEAIVSDGLPKCKRVERENCTKLTRLPPLAPDAKI